VIFKSYLNGSVTFPDVHSDLTATLNVEIFEGFCYYLYLQKYSECMFVWMVHVRKRLKIHGRYM